MEQLRAIQLLVIATQFDTGKDVLALLVETFSKIRKDIESDNLAMPDGETVFDWVNEICLRLIAGGLEAFETGIREYFPEFADSLHLMDLTQEQPAQTFITVAMLENQFRQ